MKRAVICALVLTSGVAGALRLVPRSRPARPAPSSIDILHCGRLLDVRSGQVTRNADIVTQDSKIAAVGTALPIPAGARVVDLSRATVLPGLIDAHTHITYHFDAAGHFGSSRIELPGTTLRYAEENARKTLEAGYTTIRNLGAGELVDIKLRDAVNKGEAAGPRLLVSGSPLTPESIPPLASRDARLEAIREYVRIRQRQGVDIVKIFEGVDDRDTPLFSEAEIRAAVDEAAPSGMRVAVHAHEASAIKAAVLGGCTSIEHGSFGDDECWRLMRAHHTVLVPTLFLPTYYLEHKSQFDFDEGTWDFFRRLQSHNIANARSAHEAGVEIVAGSDAVAGVPGRNARELEWLVKAGLTPAQAIRAATCDAASLLGWPGKVGEIKTGAYADIIAVQGDPLRDVTVLQHVGFVMKGGQIARDGLTGGSHGGRGS